MSYDLIARLIHLTDRIPSLEGIGASFVSRRNRHSSLASVRCTCPINQHNTNYHSRGSCVRFSVSWKSALNKSARMKTIKLVTVSREKYRRSCFHESIYVFVYNIIAGRIPFTNESNTYRPEAKFQFSLLLKINFIDHSLFFLRISFWEISGLKEFFSEIVFVVFFYRCQFNLI